MGADRFFKKPGYKNFIFAEYRAADRTNPAALSFQTIDTAGNMHKTVFAAEGRKSSGFYPFALFQQGAANRTGSRRAGKTCALGFGTAVFSFIDGHGKAPWSGKKQTKAEPKQNHAGKG